MSDESGVRVRLLASTAVRQTQDWPEQGTVLNTTNQEQTAEDGDLGPNGTEDGKFQQDLEDDEHPDDSSIESSDSSSASDSGYETVPSKPVDQFASCIYQAQLSPDATCVFTTDYSRTFSVYPVSPSLWESQDPQPLKPFAQFHSPSPIWSFAVNPYFDCNNSETTTVLVATRDQHIGLHNALWDVTKSTEDGGQKPVNISTKVASYKLVNQQTEALITPFSMTWFRDGNYFYAGHRDRIAIFDASYSEAPIATISTIPSTRNKLKGGGRGFKGDISALSLSPPSLLAHEGILAAGARSRNIGLYDPISAEEITHITLPSLKDHDDGTLQYPVGHGVSHLQWSPDGKYLYVSERTSPGILIFDVRKFSLALGYCAGRPASTKQCMAFDIWPNESAIQGGHEVWAGGDDGAVRYWSNPHLQEGAVEANQVLDFGEGSIGSVLVHPAGNVAVIAKGMYSDADAEKGNMSKGYGPRYKEWGSLDIVQLM